MRSQHPPGSLQRRRVLRERAVRANVLEPFTGRPPSVARGEGATPPNPGVRETPFCKLFARYFAAYGGRGWGPTRAWPNYAMS